MSSAAQRLPLAVAAALAEEIAGKLRLYCDRLEIAGSIRRRKHTVGDIEIVCIPTVTSETLPWPSLFGDETRTLTENQLENIIGVWLEAGIVTPRLNKDGKQAIGPKLKWLTYRGFELDIYVTDNERWGATLAIRTGDEDFAHRLVTSRAYGGYCPPHLHFRDWRVCHVRDGEVIPTHEERQVFEALGLRWVDPSERTGALQLRDVLARSAEHA